MFVAELVMLEVAIGPARVQGLFGDLASVAVNPNSLGVVSVTVGTPVEAGATLRWTDSGGSGSQAIAAAGTYTKTFAGLDITDVTLIEIDPDPDPDQPG
jgi:hypothetical protein